MRILFTCLLLPFFAGAQINRSANELARENVQEYLSKVFKGQAYKQLTPGELKAVKKSNPEIVWSFEQRCETAEIKKEFGKSGGKSSKVYSFLFYLDEKLKILKAESTI